MYNYILINGLNYHGNMMLNWLGLRRRRIRGVTIDVGLVTGFLAFFSNFFFLSEI